MKLGGDKTRPTAASMFAISISLLVLAIAGCGGGGSAPTLTPTMAPTLTPVAGRIGVRQASGLGEFYNTSTGATFVPRGNNYVRLAPETTFYGNAIVYHSTFVTGSYNSALAEAALTKMSADGYNVVRAFLSGCCPGSMYQSASGPVNQAYLANVADFLRRAKNNGIRVVLTTDFAFGRDSSFAGCTANFGGENIRYLTSCGVSADKGFFADLINGLNANGAPLDAILSYELRNELFFEANQLPLSLTNGIVTTANGQTYDMSSSSSRQRMMDDGMVFWANQVASQIKALDPRGLVDIGFFAPNAPTPWRDTIRLDKPYPALASSNVDYVKFSLYPNIGLTLAQAAANFGFAGYQQKPIVMGEYGALTSGYASASQAALTLQAWQVDSCNTYSFKGWLLWTWDTEPAEQVAPPFYTAVDDGGAIEHALAPAIRPNPCA